MQITQFYSSHHVRKPGTTTKNPCRSRYPARNHHYVLGRFWWRNSRIVCIREKDHLSTLLWAGRLLHPSLKQLFSKPLPITWFILVLLYALVLEFKIRPARYWACSMLLEWAYFRDKVPFCKKTVAKEVGGRLFEVGVFLRDVLMVGYECRLSGVVDSPWHAQQTL